MVFLRAIGLFSKQNLPGTAECSQEVYVENF